MTGKASTKLVEKVLLSKKQVATIKKLTARNKALAAKNARLAAQNAAQAATNRAQAAAINELNAWVWAHTDHPAPPDVPTRTPTAATTASAPPSRTAGSGVTAAAS